MGRQSAETVSRRMSRVQSRDTAPELLVRTLVYGMGHRYRLGNRDLPGSPDLANRARAWAIFVHGCFWHAHEGCRLAGAPKVNPSYWLPKLEGNRRRDVQAVRALRRGGFRVLVVWQCELASEGWVVGVLREFLGGRRDRPRVGGDHSTARNGR